MTSTHLPVHPFTRLTAIGLRRDGRPIWPVLGGDGTTAPPAGTVPTTPATPPGGGAGTPPADQGAPAAGTPPGDPGTQDDKPLGPGGEKALQAERDARKALEKELAALSPLKKLAEALGGGQGGTSGKSEVELLNERFAEHEKTVEQERAARWRAEVAHEKGLTPAQAARLVGGTREELAADADQLRALFPAGPEGPRTPAPDPSQGARGAGTAAGDLDTQIAEAQKNRDVNRVIALQRQKLQHTK